MLKVNRDGWIAIVGVVLATYLMGGVVMKRQSPTWSFAEIDRAKATCDGVDRGRSYDLCFENHLYQWRKDNPGAPRGSAGAWPWSD